MSEYPPIRVVSELSGELSGSAEKGWICASADFGCGAVKHS